MSATVVDKPPETAQMRTFSGVSAPAALGAGKPARIVIHNAALTSKNRVWVRLGLRDARTGALLAAPPGAWVAARTGTVLTFTPEVARDVVAIFSVWGRGARRPQVTASLQFGKDSGPNLLSFHLCSEGDAF